MSKACICLQNCNYFWVISSFNSFDTVDVITPSSQGVEAIVDLASHISLKQAQMFVDMVNFHNPFM